MSNTYKVCERKESSLLLQTCQKLIAFLTHAHQQPLEIRQRASLETSPTGTLLLRKVLPCGLDLVAESVAPMTATLRIFFDPRRFESWRASQGNLGLFYANPYGIEIVYEENVWGFFVDERQLQIRLRNTKPHEVACLDIQQVGDVVEVHLQQPGGEYESSSGPEAAALPDPIAHSNRVLPSARPVGAKDHVPCSDETQDIRSRLLAALA